MVRLVMDQGSTVVHVDDSKDACVAFCGYDAGTRLALRCKNGCCVQMHAMVMGVGKGIDQDAGVEVLWLADAPEDGQSGMPPYGYLKMSEIHRLEPVDGTE